MSEPHNPRRVFVVDDERVIAWSLAMILCQQGFDATAFTVPLEALQAARSSPPDLLISDVVMPLSGIDLATRVQRCCPDCRVLLFSGQAVTADLLEDARVDEHHYELFAKPVHPRDVLSKIESLSW